MGFQIIIYAGTGNFGVLTSPDQPPALLPLATNPTVWYCLEWVAAAGFTEALLIAGTFAVLSDVPVCLSLISGQLFITHRDLPVRLTRRREGGWGYTALAV